VRIPGTSLQFPLDSPQLLLHNMISAEVYDESTKYRNRPLFSEEWWRVTLSSIGDGVIATDAVGKVSFLNPIAEGLTGWTQRAAEGRPLEEISHSVKRRPGRESVSTGA
jgi:PAS domain-containing protein